VWAVIKRCVQRRTGRRSNRSPRGPESLDLALARRPPLGPQPLRVMAAILRDGNHLDDSVNANRRDLIVLADGFLVWRRGGGYLRFLGRLSASRRGVHTKTLEFVRKQTGTCSCMATTGRCCQLSLVSLIGPHKPHERCAPFRHVCLDWHTSTRIGMSEIARSPAHTPAHYRARISRAPPPTKSPLL
jgi:hypothetical protein